MTAFRALLLAGCALLLTSALDSAALKHKHGKKHKAKPAKLKVEASTELELGGELFPGDYVIIDGLTTSDGRMGKVERFDSEKGKFLVRFEDGKGTFFYRARLFKVPAESGLFAHVGDEVTISAERTASSGKRGTIEKWDDEKKKFLVRLEDGRGVFFLPGKLSKVSQATIELKDKEQKPAEEETSVEESKDELASERQAMVEEELDKKEKKASKKAQKDKKKGLSRTQGSQSASKNAKKNAKKEKKEKPKWKTYRTFQENIAPHPQVTKAETKLKVLSKTVYLPDEKARQKDPDGGRIQFVEKKKVFFGKKRNQPNADFGTANPPAANKPKPNAAASGGLGYYLAPLYKQAAREEKLPEKVPGWPVLFKYPRSWIEKVEAMDHTKTRKFNFIGSFYKNAATKNARKWVIDFVQHNFKKDDFFRITGPHDKHVSLGEFDHTFDKSDASYPFKRFTDPDFVAPFDENYFNAMVKSKFTLCPAGDGPWSIRFFEAFLADSIPIVEKERHAIGMEGPKMHEKLAWKYYILNDDPDYEYEYRQDWVDENKAKFMKYFTFLQGNNKL